MPIPITIQGDLSIVNTNTTTAICLVILADTIKCLKILADTNTNTNTGLKTQADTNTVNFCQYCQYRCSVSLNLADIMPIS